MLLLAGTDRLDKALTIGQMQGRFQLVLMPTAGARARARPCTVAPRRRFAGGALGHA
jgi:hypothetical protein